MVRKDEKAINDMIQLMRVCALGCGMQLNQAFVEEVDELESG